MFSHRVPRLARKVVFVCLALVAAIGALLFVAVPALARPRSAAGHVAGDRKTTMNDVVRAKYPTRALSLRDGNATILAFPPRAPASSKEALTVVYLHGIHGRAENGCPWLREGASEIGWLVCPEANEHLANDTFSWAGNVNDQRAVVARAEHAAQAQGANANAPGVLVGFSQGAYVALDLLHAHLGHYRGLVLIGAEVQPTRELLASSGVTRVVLAAGDLDGSSQAMKRAADNLAREGVEVRFVSLGPIGHSYETTNKDSLANAIAWSGSST